MYEIKELLDLDKTIAAKLFEGKTYPWEALDGIKSFILELEKKDVLPAIAASRSLLMAGGEYDMKRAADVFLDDLRSGRLGKVSFEKPE